MVLPRSRKIERIKAVAPEKLLSEPTASTATMQALDACDDGTKYCWNPEGIEI